MKKRADRPASSCIHHPVADLLRYGEEYLGRGAHEEGADDGADAKRTPQEEAAEGKYHVNRDPHDSELPAGLVADDHGDEIVGTRAALGFDHDGHAERQYHAAQHQRDQPEDHGGLFVDDVLEQNGKHIDDGAAQHHAQQRPDLDIAPVHKEEDQNNQKADAQK